MKMREWIEDKAGDISTRIDDVVDFTRLYGDLLSGKIKRPYLKKNDYNDGAFCNPIDRNSIDLERDEAGHWCFLEKDGFVVSGKEAQSHRYTILGAFLKLPEVKPYLIKQGKKRKEIKFPQIKTLDEEI